MGSSGINAIVLGALSNGGGQSHFSKPQIVGEDSSGFTVRVDEEEECTDPKHKRETLSWLSAQPGVYGEDQKFEVGSVEMSGLSAGRSVTEVKFSKNLFKGKEAKDVLVFLNVGVPKKPDEYMVLRLTKVTKKGFAFTYLPAVKNGPDHSERETVNWLAVAAGSGKLFGGRRFAAGRTGKKVSDKKFKLKNLSKYGLSKKAFLPFLQVQTTENDSPVQARVEKVKRSKKKKGGVLQTLEFELEQPASKGALKKKKKCKYGKKLKKKEDVAWLLLEG